MSLRSDINKIIFSNTSKCRGMLILQYLDDKGIELDGNGWIDDDSEAQEKLYSNEINSELEGILGENNKDEISPATLHYLDDIMDVFNCINIDHIVYEIKDSGPHFYSPDNRFNTFNSNPDINRELVMAIKQKTLIDFDSNEHKTGKFTIASGKEVIVSIETGKEAPEFHFRLNK